MGSGPTPSAWAALWSGAAVSLPRPQIRIQTDSSLRVRKQTKAATAAAGFVSPGKAAAPGSRTLTEVLQGVCSRAEFTPAVVAPSCPRRWGGLLQPTREEGSVSGPAAPAWVSSLPARPPVGPHSLLRETREDGGDEIFEGRWVSSGCLSGEPSLDRHSKLLTKALPPEVRNNVSKWGV